MHEPHHYNLPNHLARICESKEFAAAAKESGKSLDDFRAAVTRALKGLMEQHRREELLAFEQEVTERVLAAAKHA